MTTPTAIDEGPRDRRGLEVLSTSECLELLGSEPVGRLAYMEAGEPMVLPVAHTVDGWTVAFRTTPGSKLSMASMERPVAFEVDHFDAATRTGWSVLVRGTTEMVLSEDVEEHLESLGLDSWTEMGVDHRWVRIHATGITGRRVGSPAAAEVGP